MINRNSRYQYKLRINDREKQLKVAKGAVVILTDDHQNKTDRNAGLKHQLELGVDLSATAHIAKLYFETKDHFDTSFVTIMLDYGITCTDDFNDPSVSFDRDRFNLNYYSLLYQAKPHMEKFVRPFIGAKESIDDPVAIYKSITPTEFFYQFEFGEETKEGRFKVIHDIITLVLQGKTQAEVDEVIRNNHAKTEDPVNIKKIIAAAFKQKNDLAKFKSLAGGHISLRENLDVDNNSTFIFYKPALDLCMGYLILQRTGAGEEVLKEYRKIAIDYYNQELTISDNPMHRATSMNKFKRSALYADAISKDHLMLDFDGVMVLDQIELVETVEGKKKPGTLFSSKLSVGSGKVKTGLNLPSFLRRNK